MVKFVHYTRELVINVIVITTFDCIVILDNMSTLFENRIYTIFSNVEMKENVFITETLS